MKNLKELATIVMEQDEAQRLMQEIESLPYELRKTLVGLMTLRKLIERELNPDT